MKRKFITGFICGAVAFGTVGVFAGQFIATENTFPIQLNGENISMDGYNIEGNTYFKLRDISDIVGGFDVGFDNNTIKLSTTNDIASTPTPQPTVEPTPVSLPTVAPITEKEETMATKPLSEVIYGHWQHNSDTTGSYYTLSFSDSIVSKDIGTKKYFGKYEVNNDKVNVTLYEDIKRTTIAEQYTLTYKNGRLYFSNSDEYLRKMD